MLTGENRPSGGDAFVDGKSVSFQWREVQSFLYFFILILIKPSVFSPNTVLLTQVGKSVGYCPQYDAVLKELSGWETLELFARIRGVPERKIQDVRKLRKFEESFSHFSTSTLL